MGWIILAIALQLAPSASLAMDRFIDFETFPDGSTPTLHDALDPDAYLAEGVRFLSLDGSGGIRFNWAPFPGDFGIRDGTAGDVGFHIAAEFLMPVSSVSAQILNTNTRMIAFDIGGLQVAAVGGSGGSVLTIEGVGPIASVLWQSTNVLAVAGIDDVAFTFVPEPASGGLLALGLAALASRGRRSS